MTFNLQPSLENELIQLRPLVAEDCEALYEVAKDPMIWAQHPDDRHEKNRFELFFEESIASNGALVIIDKTSSEIIGSSRFKLVENDINSVEIGWTFLSRKYWGGEFNRKTKKLMIDYALLHVDKIVFYIDMNNIRSQKAIEKIGGKLLVEPEYNNLIESNGTDLIYLIDKSIHVEK